MLWYSVRLLYITLQIFSTLSLFKIPIVSMLSPTILPEMSNFRANAVSTSPSIYILETVVSRAIAGVTAYVSIATSK